MWDGTNANVNPYFVLNTPVQAVKAMCPQCSRGPHWMPTPSNALSQTSIICAFRIKDPKKSLDFYTRILGMRWVRLDS